MEYKYRAFICGWENDRVAGDPASSLVEYLDRQLTAAGIAPNFTASWPLEPAGPWSPLWYVAMLKSQCFLFVCTRETPRLEWVDRLAIAFIEHRDSGATLIQVRVGAFPPEAQSSPALDKTLLLHFQSIDLSGDPAVEDDAIRSLAGQISASKGRSLPADDSSASVSVSVPSYRGMAEPPASMATLRNLTDVQPPNPPDAPVTFTAFTPACVVPKTSFVFDLWAHTSAQEAAVSRQAAALGRGRAAGAKTGIPVARGAVLGIILEIPSLRIADPIESLVWDGDPVNASFIVEVPADAAAGDSHPGRALISAAGIPIAKLSFVLAVDERPGQAPLPGAPLTLRKSQPRTAFASYSSKDRAEVLGRVHGMRKILPELEVFLDVLTLRSGQDWDSQLREQIPSKDVFFLFWSEHAARSREVEKEWRMALETRGADYVDPVPLVDPSQAPPPPELGHLHFNDFYLAYIKQSRAGAPPRPWWKVW